MQQKLCLLSKLSVPASAVSVINEQCTYEFEMGNQSCTEETSLRMLTTALTNMCNSDTDFTFAVK